MSLAPRFPVSFKWDRGRRTSLPSWTAPVAPDLKSAKVYISVYDTDKDRAEESFSVIKENAGFIRRELAKVMRLRTVPELRVLKDGSMEYGEKIDKILFDLGKKDE